jgi:hypothetical protein
MQKPSSIESNSSWYLRSILVLRHFSPTEGESLSKGVEVVPAIGFGYRVDVDPHGKSSIDPNNLSKNPFHFDCIVKIRIRSDNCECYFLKLTLRVAQ